MLYLYSILLGYLIGSIPVAVLLCGFFFKTDIRQKGSGNPGATNVYRCFGWKPALAVLVLDMLKGAIPVLLAGHVFEFEQLSIFCAGGFALAGHVFPAFGLVRGGKGVATSAGVFMVLAPVPLILSVLVYAAFVYLFKIGSLASLSAAVALCISSWFTVELSVFYFSLGFAVLIFLTHYGNIRNLLQGKESRINQRGL